MKRFSIFLVLFGLCATFATSAEPVDDARLPASYRLLAHGLDIEADPDAVGYHGESTITFSIAQETNAIYFHAQQLELQAVNLETATTNYPLSTTTNAYGRVRAVAPATIAPGELTLRVRFSAPYNERGTGIYRATQGGKNLLFTQMEPEFARQAFPCFDEPAFKAPWTLQLQVPTNCLAYANAPIANQVVTNNLQHIRFKTTPPLPIYLMALAVGPFESVDVPGMSIPGKIICPPGQTNLTSVAVSMTPPILKALEDYFGSTYPYAKQDQIAVPEFNFGAMENPGLITYRDTILLADTNAISVRQKQGMSKTIAHELAHIWFGDLVTPAWWNDLWLNESFASWMAQKICVEVFPEFEFTTQDIAARQRAMSADSLPSAYAIRREVDGPYDKTNLFDALSYSKGMAILTMIEDWIGAESFQAGMQAYMKKHAWKNADAFDLTQSLDPTRSNQLTELMRTYTTQPGIPLVHFKKISENQVEISQSPYRLLSDTNQVSRSWPIPIRLELASNSQTKQQRLMLGSTPEYLNLAIPLSLTQSGYFSANANEKGYYRWVLEGFPPVQPNSLHLRGRLGYLDNLDALLQAGAISPVRYLEDLRTFSASHEPEVLNALAQTLNELQYDLIEPHTSTGFARYTEQLLLPGLDHLGWEAKPNERIQAAKARAALIETLGMISAPIGIMERARQKAEVFMEAPTAVDPNLAPVWLKLAARRGDRALFTRFQQQFEQHPNPTIQKHYLNALGHFTDKDIALEALGYSLSDAITPQEWGRIPSALADQPAFREMVFTWYKSYYQTIKAKVPFQYLRWHIYFAAYRDADLIAQARAFLLDPARTSQGVEIECQKAAEIVRQRLALYTPHQAALRDYFAQDFSPAK